MANTPKYTHAQIEHALKECAGLQYLAAKMLQCSPATIGNYIKRSKKLQNTLEEAREASLDMAEAQLITKIKEGELTAIIFYLKTVGKHRGYTERQEVTGADGEAINYVIEAPPVIEDQEQWAALFKPKSTGQ